LFDRMRELKRRVNMFRETEASIKITSHFI
jgi:hypothetical protein